MTHWFDTRSGISDRITMGRGHVRSLQGLLDVVDARVRWRREDEQRRLSRWVIVGRLILDDFGQVGRICVNAPADAVGFMTYERQDAFHLMPVMTMDEAAQYSAGLTWTIASLPSVGTPCFRCGESWTLSNAHDFALVDNAGSGMDSAHASCVHLGYIQQAYDDLREILRRADVSADRIYLIPSRYHRSPAWFGGPWIAADTAKGRLTLGLRKRVYELQWTWTTPDDLFRDEDVTKGPRMVHAWGAEKAVEYLRRIWQA